MIAKIKKRYCEAVEQWLGLASTNLKYQLPPSEWRVSNDTVGQSLPVSNTPMPESVARPEKSTPRNEEAECKAALHARNHDGMDAREAQDKGLI